MALRIPLRTVLSSSLGDETGVSSVGGGVPLPFTILQDTDNIVVKMTSSTVSGGMSAVLQTTDDGGTTWYDVARTSIVSNANNTTAEWISAPVAGFGVNTQVKSTVNAGSVLGGTIGSAAASTLGSRQISGMPILSQQARVFVIITGNVTPATGSGTTVQVKVNSQAAIS